MRCLFILLMALLLTVSGCTQPETAAIRLGIASAAHNLDPRFATDATSARVNRLLYRRLVDFDERMMPTPDLADWELLSPTHYRFTLRDTGRNFHNGKRLTSQDVKATYDYVLDEANASPHRGSLALIERIEVIDDDRLDFYLSRPDPLFPGYLVIGIVPETLEQNADLQNKPVGSGPLRFVSRPDASRLVLERSADQQSIEIIQVKDPTVRVLKLQRAELDLVQNDLPGELIAYLQEQHELRVQHHKGSNFAYLGFNLEQGPTSNPAIRDAIGYAVDREAIIKYLLSGGARIAGTLLPPEHWASNAALQGQSYNPDKARALLESQGYNDENPLEISYKTSSDALRIRIATVIQDQLKQVGIRVNIQSYDWGTFYGDIKAGRFEMFSLAWVGIKTPDIFRYVFHSTSLPPAGANRGRYRSAMADQLIEQAEASPTLQQQAALYTQLALVLAAEKPYIPLWYEDHVAVMRNNIRDYPLALDGNYDGLLTVTRE